MEWNIKFVIGGFGYVEGQSQNLHSPANGKGGLKRQDAPSSSSFCVCVVIISCSHGVRGTWASRVSGGEAGADCTRHMSITVLLRNSLDI